MKKGLLLVGAVVLGTVALTAVVWHGSWFGARLSDQALLDAMRPESKARDAQHGVSEIERRFEEHAVGMDRWAKDLVVASRRPEAPVRVVAAWAMGADPGRAEFVARLRELVLGDASALVRRNAACALAKAKDPAARPVLRSMLEPFTVTSPAAGVVSSVPGVDAVVREEKSSVGRVAADDGASIDVLSPVPGRVVERRARDGARVAAGDAVVVLAPDALHAHDAAAALALVGTIEDVEILSLAAAPQSSFPEDVKAAARWAVDAIRARTK